VDDAGRTAIETAETPDRNAKKIAASLRECRSPIIPNIVILPFGFRHDLSRSRKALLSGVGITRRFDGS
jgi:hypothetical protein